MRFEIDLREYSITTIPQYITEVDILTLNFQELSNEIDEFNKEIEWKEMWTTEDARGRLLNGWKLVIYKPGDRIRGWYWLDNTKEPRNIYVNKHYRGIGIAREMQFKLLNICKSLGMERVECSIDDWNLVSMKSFKSTGWSEVS
jgi:RimJ/RimL family protein N-acetyltransferase